MAIYIFKESGIGSCFVQFNVGIKKGIWKILQDSHDSGLLENFKQKHGTHFKLILLTKLLTQYFPPVSDMDNCARLQNELNRVMDGVV